MYISLHIKYLLFLLEFNETCTFLSTDFQISNFMNILPVGAGFFHADGQTDRQTDGRTDGQTL